VANVKRLSSCKCGQVKFEAAGKPILAAVCYCKDCQAGGKLIEALDGAHPVLESDGGASYLMFRDDRFECVSGEHLLVGYKLKDRTPTKRFVASCCNSAMYLKFKPGHWASTYRNRFDEADSPPVALRINTRSRRSDIELTKEIPSFQKIPLRLFVRMFFSRLGMALGL
jgi:hypothetical protein